MCHQHTYLWAGCNCCEREIAVCAAHKAEQKRARRSCVGRLFGARSVCELTGETSHYPTACVACDRDGGGQKRMTKKKVPFPFPSPSPSPFFSSSPSPAAVAVAVAASSHGRVQHERERGEKLAREAQARRAAATYGFRGRLAGLVVDTTTTSGSRHGGRGGAAGRSGRALRRRDSPVEPLVNAQTLSLLPPEGVSLRGGGCGESSPLPPRRAVVRGQRDVPPPVPPKHDGHDDIWGRRRPRIAVTEYPRVARYHR